jgi:hypothetical protein
MQLADLLYLFFLLSFFPSFIFPAERAYRRRRYGTLIFKHRPGGMSWDLPVNLILPYICTSEVHP